MEKLKGEFYARILIRLPTRGRVNTRVRVFEEKRALPLEAPSRSEAIFFRRKISYRRHDKSLVK